MNDECDRSRTQGRVDLGDARRALSDALDVRRVLIGTAESCTAGAIAQTLASIPNASTFFRGGLVAYQPEVKFDVLGVRPGPVINRETATQMALGACELLQAELTVAVTGVGGPDDEEGEPAGTVFIAVANRTTPDTIELRSARLELEGAVEEVIEQTVAIALQWLADEVGRNAPERDEPERDGPERADVMVPLAF